MTGRKATAKATVNTGNGKARQARTASGITELIRQQWERERPDLDLDNFLLSIYMMRLGTWVERAFDRMCHERWNIGGGDMRVLFALRRSGSPYVKRPTDLFRALLVTSGAMTKKVDRLVEAGFVERQPDPAHSGGFLVHLTKRGLQVVNQATVAVATESVLEPAMSQFTREEREMGMQFVLRILSAMEAQDNPDEERNL